MPMPNVLPGCFSIKSVKKHSEEGNHEEEVKSKKQCSPEPLGSAHLVVGHANNA